jgi:hypothetical protein
LTGGIHIRNCSAELEEVTQRIMRHSTMVKRSDERDFDRLVIPVPLLRKEARNGYSFVSESRSSVIEIWDYIWNNSEWFEVMYQALYYYQGKSLNKSELAVMIKWLDRCQCWEHSDDLSKIFAQVVEENPGWILPTLREWNGSDSLWKRRQSVVSLVEYARKRKTVLSFDELISFVDNLLDDKEYYVQKGVGWTLREIYNLYPSETLKYLQDNILLIPPNGYSAATAKLDKITKSRMNLLRKARKR